MKKTYSVSGMHCVSCETLLEKEVLELPEVVSSQASFKKGELFVESKKEIPKENIRNIIAKCGYQMGRNIKPKKRNILKNLLEIGVITFILLVLFYFFSKIEITRFFPNISEKTGIGISLLTGLVASVSTCLALTGGVVMSFSSEYTIKKEASILQRAYPQVIFHIGRIGGFVLLGGFLGLLGEKIQYSPSFTGYLTILVALIMFYIGLHILEFVPNITRFGIHLPKGIEQYIYSWRKKNHPLAPAIIGFLTFFLPCGFTQSM